MPENGRCNEDEGPAMKKSIDPRGYSRIVMDGARQAPSRAMLRAVGFRDEDFGRPQIGVASTWGNVTPCNMHIGELAREASVGANAAGKLSDAGLLEIERTAIPGPGSCGGMYTANTMASAIEALGLSLPGSSAQEAVGEDKRMDCRRAGEAVVRLVRSGLKPRDILTRQAFENAITVVIALGGSTNAVLHLLAIAHEARVRLDLDDFTRIGRRVPVLADLKPSGRYLMSELIAIGGIQPLMKMPP